MTFVIVGGGPTGVNCRSDFRAGTESAGRRFPHDRSAAHAHRADRGGPRLLAAFPPTRVVAIRPRMPCRKWASRSSSAVPSAAVMHAGITVPGEIVAAGTVLWARGRCSLAAARWLGVDADLPGSVEVQANLQRPGSRK